MKFEPGELEKAAQFLRALKAAGIEHPVTYVLSLRPRVYDYLRGALPRGILPTDIDGEAEVNGHFLRFEFKETGRLRSATFPHGQHRAFCESLATRRTTIFHVGVCADIIQAVRIWRPPPLGHSPFEDCNANSLWLLTHRWGLWAEKQIRDRPIFPTSEWPVESGAAF